jgi:hypothetical protein
MLEIVSAIFGNIVCRYKREGIVPTKSKIVSAEFEIVLVESKSVSMESGSILE